tara:strand:- start:224 stop:937 length:714 start_codon:yes stop_codon:yes gene_type:complete
MSNTKIHYFGVNTPGECLVKERIDEDYIYSQCPVVHHKNNRIFVAHSPIDFEVRVDRTSEGVFVRCDDQDLLQYEETYFTAPKPVLQVKSPMFLFWTEAKNVWFEFDAHPMTSLTNNFIAVGGWFNLSNWSRTSSLAMTIVDETKPVIIKKGDPVCTIRFYPTDNLDDGVILKEEKNPKVIEKLKNKYAKKQRAGWDDKNWKGKLFSKTDNESKCPVSFLFGKTKKKKSNLGTVRGF